MMFQYTIICDKVQNLHVTNASVFLSESRSGESVSGQRMCAAFQTSWT